MCAQKNTIEWHNSHWGTDTLCLTEHSPQDTRRFSCNLLTQTKVQMTHQRICPRHFHIIVELIIRFYKTQLQLLYSWNLRDKPQTSQLSFSNISFGCQSHQKIHHPSRVNEMNESTLFYLRTPKLTLKLITNDHFCKENPSKPYT